jgi:hypothetical protein
MLKFVMLAIFTSAMEALNDTGHCIPETNGYILMKQKSLKSI